VKLDGVLEGVSYQVTSVKIGGQTVQGGIVPGSALRSFAPGSEAGATISVIRKDNKKPYSFKHSFTIQ
jgi:hypothetical protein